MKRGRGENKNSLLHQYREDVQWLKENLSAMVKNAMEEKATENGNITATFVAEQVAMLP